MAFLNEIVEDTRNAIDEGYYDLTLNLYSPKYKLSESIMRCKNIPIIGEIKFASPSLGKIREYIDPARIAVEMVNAGVIGLSVLTNKRFAGKLDYLINVRIAVDSPLLMKDIIIDKRQIDAAYRCGVNCILLISSILKNDIKEFIEYAHKHDLEVLLEVHTQQEFLYALKSDADMIGINNRDLNTMRIDISTTERLLKNNDLWKDKIIISESGIESAQDIRRLVNAGAKAFLIGTSIMKSNNIKAKLDELVRAI